MARKPTNKYIVRLDSMPPLYYGPFTKKQARRVSGKLQDKFLIEVGTYMILPLLSSDTDLAVEFNDPEYVDPDEE